MYFVSIYENRRMKLVEIVLRSGGGERKENNGGCKSNLRYIISTYVNTTIFPLHNSYMLIKLLTEK
jgi:hypothetical protein